MILGIKKSFKFTIAADFEEKLDNGKFRNHLKMAENRNKSYLSDC
jgi:hypothetical protein